MYFLISCLQERKEFEQKFSKEQGAIREQLQVNSYNRNIIFLFFFFFLAFLWNKAGKNLLALCHFFNVIQIHPARVTFLSALTAQTEKCVKVPVYFLSLRSGAYSLKTRHLQKLLVSVNHFRLQQLLIKEFD
ncbi:hypothetical protein XENOCAPTIV_004686 [Xenoophorus captivus]|uniref:Uncharacterized protein n=1 Tax=Xenoophorus captivus TaxID=1517983 RepID=A0ABV0QCQ6_9TELE